MNDGIGEHRPWPMFACPACGRLWPTPIGADACCEDRRGDT